MKQLLLLALLTVLLVACAPQNGQSGPAADDDGITARHQATLPAEYSGLTNPIPADDASLARGEDLYAVNCASCHGATGMGDGPAAAALDPGPPALAQTSQEVADDYLFWRISEGGTPFGTAMPAWKVLGEQDRWDLVNYLRSLRSKP